MKIYTRFEDLPQSFRISYEHLLVVMQLLASDLRMKRGGIGRGNCHSVVRALAKLFPGYRVVDGFVPSLSTNETDETHGPKAVLLIEGEPPVKVRYKQLNHSWLQWQDTNIIVDVWPIGAGAGMGLPLVHFQDGYDIQFVEAALPESDLAQVEEDTKVCLSRLGSIVDNLPF